MKAAVANGLVQALTWRLRERQIRIGTFEMEQAAAVLSTQESWTKQELHRVLLPIFCKRHELRGLVSDQIEELLTVPAPPAKAAAKAVLHPGDRESGAEIIVERAPSPWQRLVEAISRFFAAVRSPKWISRLLWLLAISFLFAALILAFPGGLPELGGRFGLAVKSVLGAITNPLGTDLGKTDEDPEGLAFALLIRHSTVSALIASSVVAVFLLFGLRNGRGQDGKTALINDPEPPAKGDNSVFRVGSLGGPPPPFLAPQLASEIVELLNYRYTDRDRRDLDLRATVGSRVRGNMDSLIFEKSKELPTVVILADSAGDAHYWNSIAREFQTELERRGLKVETFAFSGPFSEINQSNPYQNDTIASALQTIAQGNGWMLTTVFADLRRLSRRDAALLADLREQGPVLAFDYNDTRLWHRRQKLLDGHGIATHPATGIALRQALAIAFAPDRAAVRQIGIAKSTQAVFESLSQPHAQWATACAMVQPVSFALAEKLRRAQPELAGDTESLAFSLLARLPGSWVGPEGLRFSAQIRRQLLSRSSDIPRSQQFAFLQVLDDAFGEEPKSITSAELWRYTRAQAELFSPRQVRALQDLADIKAGGLIDETQFNDFVQRLRPPGEALQPGTITLPLRSSRIAVLAGPQEAKQKPEKQVEIVPATWSVGLPEVRIRLHADAAPLAAFLPGGRHILVVEPAASDQLAVFSRIDAARGNREPLSLRESLVQLELDPRDLAELMVFPQSQAGVIATRKGRLFAFHQDAGTADTKTEFSSSLSLSEIRFNAQINGTPLLALSADGNVLACCSVKSNVLVVVNVSERLKPQHVTVPGKITALVFSQGGSLLCGLESGEVFRISNSPSGFSSPERAASFGQEITALTEVGTGETSESDVVAALADGRIGLDGSQLSENANLALPWRPKWLTAFPDRKAVLLSNAPVGFSVAATGPNGEFDVIGMPHKDERYQYQGESLISKAIDPLRDGIAMLAINAERRRSVVRNGLYLEVRPLLYDLPDAGDASLGVPVENSPPSAPQSILESVQQETVSA
jgi:hypothetical protein